MKQYLDLLKHIIENGVEKDDRTGTGTISTFGYQMRFDMKDGFPLVTTKKMFTRGVIEELLWFISGSTNKKVLQEKDVHIWDQWGDDETGELGPIYGHQWRHWDTQNQPMYHETAKGVFVSDMTLSQFKKIPKYIDQLKEAIETIKTNPDSRRIIVSSWNVAQIDQMALPPCHCFFQFYVVNGKLSLQLYQRSADAFLGVPFNIASYALLLMMVAQVTGLEAGEFIHTLGDAHIYKNHIEQVKMQLQREPYALPRMVINPEVKDIDGFKAADFKLEGYQCHPAIKGEVSV